MKYHKAHDHVCIELPYDKEYDLDKEYDTRCLTTLDHMVQMGATSDSKVRSSLQCVVSAIRSSDAYTKDHPDRVVWPDEHGFEWEQK